MTHSKQDPSPYNGAHLTHVERLSVKRWEASCLCGWSARTDAHEKLLPNQGQAVAVAEIHWQEKQ